jgi:hypothetical protein
MIDLEFRSLVPFSYFTSPFHLFTFFLSLFLSLQLLFSFPPWTLPNPPTRTVPPQPTWWKDGICYQVWPSSYKDSNSDGLGDISSILPTLDYLRDLNIDINTALPNLRLPAGRHLRFRSHLSTLWSHGQHGYANPKPIAEE